MKSVQPITRAERLRKAGFRSLGDAWADTTTSHGRLMVTERGDQAPRTGASRSATSPAATTSSHPTISRLAA